MEFFINCQIIPSLRLLVLPSFISSISHNCKARELIFCIQTGLPLFQFQFQKVYCLGFGHYKTICDNERAVHQLKWMDKGNHELCIMACRLGQLLWCNFWKIYCWSSPIPMGRFADEFSTVYKGDPSNTVLAEVMKSDIVGASRKTCQSVA